MDMKSAEQDQGVTSTSDAPKVLPKKAVKRKDKASSGDKKARPLDLNAPQYNIRTTVVRKKVRVGDQGLARLLEKNWLHLHHALYYVNVFAPTAIGGRIVNAADVGVREYIQERLLAAERMYKEAKDMADQSGVEMGAPGKTSDHTVEIASQIETDVLQILRIYDDYLVVIDSLWIGREILDAKRDAAHRIVRDDISAMKQLLNKLRSRLIAYRREKGMGKLSKTEATLVTEVEDIIIASLSEEGKKQRLQARERAIEKAKKREEREELENHRTNRRTEAPAAADHHQVVEPVAAAA